MSLSSPTSAIEKISFHDHMNNVALFTLLAEEKGTK